MAFPPEAAHVDDLAASDPPPLQAAQLVKVFFLREFLAQYVQVAGAPAAVGLRWGGLLLLAGAVDTVAGNSMWFCGDRVGMRMRGALVCLLYRKGLTLSLAARARFGAGNLQMRMSVDAMRIGMMVTCGVFFVSNALKLAAIAVLLWRAVGVASLASAAVLLLGCGVVAGVVRRAFALDKRNMAERDSRAKLMSELLRGIKGVKANATSSSRR